MTILEAQQRQLVLGHEEPIGGYQKMPVGLGGYWWESEHHVCVPFIESSNAHDFLRFLRQLERKGKHVIFPNVINARLKKLLSLRGYVDGYVEFSPKEKKVYRQEYCDALVRRNP